MINLVGKYVGDQRVVRMLGLTNFTEVYLTESSFPRRLEVLKVLRVDLSGVDQENFLLTSRAIVDLVHPHIIRMREISIAQLEKNFPVLFMEYAPNGTLRQRHPIGSRLPLTTVLPYVRHISEALHYAHLQGFTHAGVRPENILLGSDNQVLLSDFSFALISSIKKTATGATAYAAPEQIMGNPCPLSDEYALGVMVYEWLSGELPFYGSLREIADQHLSAPPPLLSGRIPGISSDVERVLLTALAKDPGNRFANLLAFANALEQASLSAPSYSPHPLSLSGTHGPPSAPMVGMRQQDPSSLTGNAPPAVVGSKPSSGTAPGSPTRRISRRALIAGLPVVVVAGGGIVAWLLTQRESSTTTAGSRTQFTYFGHAGEVTAVAWSPNGKYIASGGNDHTIRIWDARTGADLLSLDGLSGGVPAIAWSPDSTRIASTTAGPSVSGGPPASENAVQVWNATTGKPVYLYHGHSGGITDIAWSPRGERIASSSTDYTVQVWDATSGKHPLIYRTHSWYVWTMAWSPDGKRIASGEPDGTIQVWDAATGHTFLTFRGHSSEVEAIAWSPDGKRIASAGDDYTVRVWNSATGKLVYLYRGHTGYVRTVAWSPNGHVIASGGNDKTVQVWDSATGKTNYTYHSSSGSVTSVTWSPDSHAIAIGSEAGPVQVLQLG
jgi:serine/threonine protein kinase